MVPLGIKLQGWVFLQKLVPLAERRLASGEWPRQTRLHLDRHPAFADPIRRMVRVSAIRAACGSGAAPASPPDTRPY
jgi:hypothetical protein